MISLDQVQLLEQKVESAVERITQLTAENDALRAKCAELTNSLSVKTEQFTSFQADQNKIEEGILNALDRLNSVENTVLETAGAESISESAESDVSEFSSDNNANANNSDETVSVNPYNNQGSY